jgi:anaerobic selenocysteine-containing dehydrogenase
MKGPASVPGTPHPSVQAGKYPPRIQHVQFGKAVLNPPITWTAGDKQFVYPEPGRSEIRLFYFVGGSGYFFNQMGNTNEHIEGIKSPKIEIVISQSPWWHTVNYFSDIVLPVAHIGERDDFVNWLNYSVYMHRLVDPPGEAINDLDVFRGLAQRLNLLDALTQGKTDDQMLSELYAKSSIPMSFDEFKQTGWYKWTLPDLDAPSVGGAKFNADPVANPLPTPSGKLEIFSQRIVSFYGPNDPQAPAIPMYIESPESLNSATAQKYPLFLDGGPHPRRGRHSQWNDTSWQRDIDYDYINGYRTMWMNPIDAQARGVKQGDVIRVFNDRGQALFGAKVSERVKPGIVWASEGGHYTPQQPGMVGTTDLGGDVNVLLPGIQMEKICHGQVTHTLVEVEKWS